MFDFLLQLAIATILVLLTTTVMQMVSVLVKLTILDRNAINIDVLDGKS